MRRVIFAASSLLLIGTSAPLLAQPAPDETPPAPSDVIEETADDAAPSSDENDDEIVVEAVKVKKVCRRHTPTGSRVPVRVCRTETEEREQTEATRGLMTELQSAGGKENEYDENGIIKANPF